MVNSPPWSRLHKRTTTFGDGDVVSGVRAILHQPRKHIWAIRKDLLPLFAMQHGVLMQVGGSSISPY